MKRSFVCSLCHNGILGGGLYIEDTAIIYKTNKLTVDQRYRNLVLPLKGIYKLSWKRVLFPIATFEMINGEEYTFIIFNKNRFKKYFNQLQSTLQLKIIQADNNSLQ